MKLQKVPVLAAAFLVAMISPEVWARGPGGHGGHRGHGHGFNRGRSLVVVSGGGYNMPYWYGGLPYGGYGYNNPGLSSALPSYYINYSPYITTGGIPASTAMAPVAECPVMASGDLVGNVQRALRQRGFYKGAIDGVSGAPTRAAIRAYAASCGFSSTGIIDAQLLSSLGLL